MEVQVITPKKILELKIYVGEFNSILDVNINTFIRL